MEESERLELALLFALPALATSAETAACWPLTHGQAKTIVTQVRLGLESRKCLRFMPGHGHRACAQLHAVCTMPWAC